MSILVLTQEEFYDGEYEGLLEEMRVLFGKCFDTSDFFEVGSNSVLYTYIYDDSISVFFLVEYGEITKIWNVCTSVIARTHGHTRILFDEVLDRRHEYVDENAMNIDDIVKLHVDYDNFYWNSAIGLYTKYKFLYPIDSGEGYCILTRVEGKEDKMSIRDAREIANELRIQYFQNEIGMNPMNITFTQEHIQNFEKLASTWNREYGGSVKISRIDEFGNWQVDGLCGLVLGNYVSVEEVDAYTLPPNDKLTFHTHPPIVRQANKMECVFNPPSNADFMSVFDRTLKGEFLHFVVENRNGGGIWFISLNPKFAKDICQLKNKSQKTQNRVANKIMDELNRVDHEGFAGAFQEFEEELDRFKKSTGRTLCDYPEISTLRQYMIQNFIQTIQTVKYKGVRVFDLTCYNWDYLDTRQTMTVTAFHNPDCGLTIDSCESYFYWSDENYDRILPLLQDFEDYGVHLKDLWRSWIVYRKRYDPNFYESTIDPLAGLDILRLYEMYHGDRTKMVKAIQKIIQVDGIEDVYKDREDDDVFANTNLEI